ncbi:restriction endonuclease subunit S [Schaalia sp. 19OD2882]|uniref:restriction endonuclease subunit S n=1 Tax=Schaalia sp. 19OD2882 TaxID=2794089 RepID=UPI001C1EEF55|nr:restriction endonuclease subunit S [Schaalia sp. 19OD2882]QWW19947.1 restriction endonuclease subunit S [Schaalia sp. 19OD2882]
MFITDVFDSMTASRAWYDKVHLADGTGRNLYLSQTLGGNSVSAVVADQTSRPEAGNCITVTLKTQSTFYQPAPFYTAQNFLIFRHENLDADSGLFLVTTMRNAMGKFSWGYGVSMARLEKTRIMVPVVTDASGEDVVDWDGMSAYGHALRVRAERAIAPVIGAPS